MHVYGVSSNMRIYLRPPVLADQRAFLAAVRASRGIHRTWVSPPSTSTAFKSFVARAQQPAYRGLLVCKRGTDTLVGVVNITEIVYGSFRSAYLGYYVFAGCERQGLMREAVLGAIRHAFRQLKLHRLEANVQSGNAASLALVRSCGFSKEGFSPRYLKIAGRWRDHERWAILAA
jgi:ribosomal-protein-alanine N-acetyltransferase